MTSRDYALLDSITAAKELAERLMDEKTRLGFDVETGYTGDPFVKRALDTSHADQFVCGFSITNNPSWARYVALRHDGAEENLPPREIWEIFRRPLQELELVAHHKKFEDKNLLVLPDKGDALEPIRTLLGHDTMLQAYVLGRWKENGLKFLTREVLGYQQTTLEELFLKVTGKELSGVAAKKMRFNVLPVVQDVIDYGCDDSAFALELCDHFDTLFESEPQRRKNILRIEREISAIMADVELYGTGVDWEGIHRGLSEYEGFKDSMHASVLEEFAKYTEKDMATVNLASVPQMRDLLYNDMGLTTTRLTGTKELSTDKIALEALQKENTAVKRLLESREVQVLGTRHKKWIDEASNAPDKRAHASYSQVTVPTGRFSASDPAIQQLPKVWFWTSDPSVMYDKKKGLVNPNGLTNGKEFWFGNYRNYIVAAPDHYLLTYDVSQGELRVLAGVSQESRLLEAYQNDEDVHTLTAAMMLGKEPDELEGEERQIGKALANSEKVLTPYGWKSMGDMQIGDEVVTPTGTAHVTGVFPQGYRKVFNVHTTDGGRVKADAEHLWKVVGEEELKKTTELTRGDALPVAAYHPADPVKPLVDPYTMGVLLGAAQFTGTAIRIDMPVDTEPVLNLCQFGEGVSHRIYRERNRKGRNEYTITAGKSKSREFTEVWRNPLEVALKVYGLRWYRGTRRVGAGAADKRIPMDYMHASYEDRLALLRGICDVKGKFTHSHSVEVECQSWDIAVQLRDLIWSLGGRAKFSTRRSPWSPRGKGYLSSGYWVHFSMEEVPFSLGWKADKYTKGLPTARTIQTVTPLEEVEECTCISLDDGIGLFVTTDYIVTHNTMNFALLYQMGVQSLSERLAIPLHKAEELYANYFKQFTSVNAWIEKTKREGMMYGYAETFMGRRVPLWGYDSPKWGTRSAAERASVNYPIQGGLADIVKVIMIRSANALKREGLWGDGVMITMNQHDALTFECRNDLDPRRIRALLNEAANFELKNFPRFIFDWEIGQRWGTSTPWKPDQDVYQDAEGYWHVAVEDKPVVVESVVIEEKEREVMEPQFVDPPELIVSVERKPSIERIKEFFELVKTNPGDCLIRLSGPGLDYTLPVKTSLTVEDAPRISLALGGANVRIPETSASLIAVGADIDFEGV